MSTSSSSSNISRKVAAQTSQIGRYRNPVIALLTDLVDLRASTGNAMPPRMVDKLAQTVEVYFYADLEDSYSLKHRLVPILQVPDIVKRQLEWIIEHELKDDSGGRGGEQGLWNRQRAMRTVQIDAASSVEDWIDFLDYVVWSFSLRYDDGVDIDRVARAIISKETPTAEEIALSYPLSRARSNTLWTGSSSSREHASAGDESLSGVKGDDTVVGA